MGFWSGLLKGAAGFIPGVGPLISAGLDAAGGLAKGAESGRLQETNNIMTQDEIRRRAMADHEGALMNRADLDLKQRAEGRTAQSDAYMKALKSALAMNMRDAMFQRPERLQGISFGGGARPSAIGAQGAEAAAMLNNQALQSLMGGSKFAELPALEKFTPSALPKAGLFEKIMGGIGVAGSALKGAQAAQTQNDQASIIKRLLQQAQAEVGVDGEDTR